MGDKTAHLHRRIRENQDTKTLSQTTTDVLMTIQFLHLFWAKLIVLHAKESF